VRTFTIVLSGILCAYSLLANAQGSDTEPPPIWKPAYWDETMLAIKSARERGDKSQAEGLCARAIPYVEQQAIEALDEYAAFLDSQHAGSGSGIRAKAQRLAQSKAQQSHAGKPGTRYLGFVPWEELGGYADALHAAQRESDSEAIRALAAAYKYSQEVYVRRMLLMREGKDPRGEC
jgi:hypothetical protein